MCKISVIMSVYNQEKFLSESVESVLCQSESSFEFLIIDDASSDRSYDLIKNYSKIDVRIKLYKNSKNLGLTKSLNKLLKIAKGKYIARMDADDISSKNRFKNELSVMSSNQDVSVVFSKADLVDASGNIICEKWQPENIKDIITSMPYHNYITHSTCMIRASIIGDLGGYNEKYKLAQDWELWLRMINSNLTFYSVNKVLLKLRMHEDNISRKNSLSNSSDGLQILILKIRNHQKMSAISTARNYKLTPIERIKFYLNLALPQSAFKWMTLMYSKYSKNSIIKRLHNQ